MKEKQRTIVSALIVSKDQKVLLGKVRDGGVYPDCWHIPGGGVEPNEDKQTALVREIQEEVGIDIAAVPSILISSDNTGDAVKTDKETGEQFLAKMRFFVYQLHIPQDSSKIIISLNDDLTEYQWVPIAQLKRYKHTPPSQKLFHQLGWL